MSEYRPNGQTGLASGTVGGLLAFFDYLVDKGLGRSSAVAPLKSAAKQVFELVEGTEHIDEVGIENLDADDYFSRFEVKAISSGKYKPESIAAYRNRFVRGLEYYKKYITTGEAPKLQLRTTSVGRKKTAVTKSLVDAQVEPQAVTAPTGDNLISYPFPLQAGGIATLRLPARLERIDAERLAAFVRTLVLEPQKQLTASVMPLDESDEA